MNIYIAVGKRIREERQKAGLTLEQLAEASSISASFLAYIERGKKKASLGTIQKLAHGLQLPIASLFSTVGSSAPISADGKIIRKLVPLLKERKPSDRELILGVLKKLSKGLPKKR